MSEAISALAQNSYSGLVDLADAGLTGMITLRGDLASLKLAEAIKEATGAKVPGVRRIETGGSGQAAWMSPDEVLLIVAYDRVASIVAGLNVALTGDFAVAADVSDARAMVTIKGPLARDMLAKVCPVDFQQFAVGEVRRTRAAQVPAAIWRSDEDSWSLVCFRSVGQYVWDLLATVSKPGGEVGLYR